MPERSAMLQLKEIHKTYSVGDTIVKALKGVTLNFRETEFVSILGPSGCGKTTLLNIIGGLDRYTSGDLSIDGKSSKDFTDSDWDTYRNNTIGFVFQSYNLIPHLSILGNVELSMTLTGVSREERKKRASEALAKVGLGEILNKKPNQLSGGQMQRVAIARAIVNNPEVILADEPTGALDSETSIQIMELLKEISKDHLIIMVTHNKELAEKYSTRIINVLDGEVVGDTHPYKPRKKTMAIKKKKESSMSIFTAFYLSFKNLWSKKAKTFLTSFAGSIGIIGVALVLAVSTGFSGYINNIQQDTLSSYPIAISTVAIDYDAVSGMFGSNKPTVESGTDDYLSIYDYTTIIGSLGHYNYISSNFVDYLAEYYQNDQTGEQSLSSMQVQYSMPLNILTKVNDVVKKVDTSISTSSLRGTTSSAFFEGVDNEDFVKNYYDVIGNYPQNKNEVALVVNKNSIISKQNLEKLGIEYNVVTSSTGAAGFRPISFNSLIGKAYKVIYNNDYYEEGTSSGELAFNEKTDLTALYENPNAELLSISGILKLKEDAPSELFDEGIMYLPSFAQNYRENCMNSEIAKKTVENKKLYKSFKVDVSEIKSFISNEDIFTFSTLAQMKSIINGQFKKNMSDSEIINLALQAVGASTIPSGVFIYPKTFEAKKALIAHIAEWNEQSSAKENIVYTDATEFLTGTMGQLIDIISYVLIAFASISLVVSSIMIGIITYTSVIERTKEIGVLRSLGARKKDISRMFNAETASIGLAAGLIGISVTYLLCPLINLIINNMSGMSVGNIALLNPLHAVILVGISMVLTLISGLIPSRIAAKKDPVIALRTE